MIDENAKRAFQTEVRDYYHDHGRDGLPWRQPTPDGRFDAYHVAVSELMLQQTQAGRVVPKYRQFLERFPTVPDLAKASLGEVLKVWSGLGYNRRAKFLWQAARIVARNHNGAFPRQPDELAKLPGIGRNTAGAILVYAYNQPAVFVETNIRTVYIHHFFHNQTIVADKAVLELVAATIDEKHPREWYWALMDYGAYLKQSVGNLNRLSDTYAKQSVFQGSKRQVRGQVLRLLNEGPRTATELQQQIPDERLPAVLNDLVAEELIRRRRETYRL